MEKKLCIFVSYSDNNYIPEYVKTYLKELRPNFDELILSTNQREISGLEMVKTTLNIDIQQYENRGYDFGLFYNSLKTLDKNNYSEIWFVNDSNFLFKEGINKVFEWSNNTEFDFGGLTNSYENIPNSRHRNSYHIQSHFLIFKKQAIELLDDFFEYVDFEKIMTDTTMTLKQIRMKIIEDCEIGLSQFLFSMGLTGEAMFDVKKYYNNNNYAFVNVHMVNWMDLINDGYPLIKKKLYLNTIVEPDVRAKLKPELIYSFIETIKNKEFNLEC